MLRRVRGFTLIELLVVIAIIAILAAILMPVFARARESARKIQCLSNVKNIATAIQMYLTDYDKLPPDEHRPEVLDYFDSYPGGGNEWVWVPFSIYPHCHRAWQSNPYLRWPVILEEYVKNRDVWRCSSARMVASVGFINPDPNWFGYLLRNEGQWGRNRPVWICPPISFPNGWGGSVTDSCLQQKQGSEDSGAFEMGISNTHWPELKTNQVEDPSWFVVVADSGAQFDSFMVGTMVLPDVCGLECAGPGCYPDWDCCPDARSLGLADDVLKTDKSLWKEYSRHLGGSNLGFMDGHAAWMRAEAILAAMDPHKYVPATIAQWEWPVFLGKMRGPNECWGPFTTPDTREDWSSGCGVPPLN